MQREGDIVLARLELREHDLHLTRADSSLNLAAQCSMVIPRGHAPSDLGFRARFLPQHRGSCPCVMLRLAQCMGYRNTYDQTFKQASQSMGGAVRLCVIRVVCKLWPRPSGKNRSSRRDHLRRAATGQMRALSASRPTWVAHIETQH